MKSDYETIVEKVEKGMAPLNIHGQYEVYHIQHNFIEVNSLKDIMGLILRNGSGLLDPKDVLERTLNLPTEFPCKVAYTAYDHRTFGIDYLLNGWVHSPLFTIIYLWNDNPEENSEKYLLEKDSYPKGLIAISMEYKEIWPLMKIKLEEKHPGSYFILAKQLSD